MTFAEFIKLVADMRKAQKAYIAMRTSDNLAQRKRLEKAVDEEIKAAMPNSNEQPTLF